MLSHLLNKVVIVIIIIVDIIKIIVNDNKIIMFIFIIIIIIIIIISIIIIIIIEAVIHAPGDVRPKEIRAHGFTVLFGKGKFWRVDKYEANYGTELTLFDNQGNVVSELRQVVFEAKNETTCNFALIKEFEKRPAQ